MKGVFAHPVPEGQQVLFNPIPEHSHICIGSGDVLLSTLDAPVHDAGLLEDFIKSP